MQAFLKIVLIASLVASCSNRRYTVGAAPTLGDAAAGFLEPERVTAGNESNFAPSLAANGSYVIYASNLGGNQNLWEKRTRGGIARQLTTHPADDFSPVLSPDGSRIAFVSRRTDAGGDIHILTTGFSLSRFLGSDEGPIVHLNGRATLDYSPAWFPDSRRLIFSGRRPGEAVGSLFVSDISDEKIVALADLRGEQPAVGPKGERVVFVDRGSLRSYDFKSEVQRTLTGPELSLFGQPSFSESGESIYVIRYLDDSNSDGIVDGNDFPTVWRMDMASFEESGQNPLSLTPLTSARYASFSPSQRGDYLYFAIQATDTLDIFRLPTSGQQPGLDDLASLVKAASEVRASDDAIYLYRRSAADFFKRNQLDEAGEALLLELRAFTDAGRRAEANLVRDKIAGGLKDKVELQMLADLEMLALDLLPISFPRILSELNLSQRRQLQAIEKSFQELWLRAADSNNVRVISSAELFRARLTAAKRDLFEAATQLRALIARADCPSSIVASGKLYLADLLSHIEGAEVSQEAYLDVIRSFPNDRATMTKAAEAAVRQAQIDREKATLRLTSLKEQRLPVVSAMAHTRIADLHLQNRLVAVAKNELRLVSKSYPESPRVSEMARKRLIQLLESDDSDSEIDSLLEAATVSEGEATRVLLRRGERLLANGEPKAARAIFERVVQTDQTNLAAHRGRIDAAYRSGELQSLIAEYETALDGNERKVSRIYPFAYLRTYEVDSASSPGEKIDAIDAVIDLLVDARNLDGQSSHIHQTLGWLYFQMSHWREIYIGTSGSGSYWSWKWELVKGFFGSPEPNWLELSVDSFLAAYFLSEPLTVQHASIEENLGYAYERLGNHDRALSYFSRRIASLKSIPARDARLEALLFRKAGRSAFLTGEYDLAESLQRRALDLWESLAADEQIAYSLDVLALTLRDSGKFVNAIEYYEKLVDLTTRLSSKLNVAKANVNLASCYLAIENFDAVMKHLSNADTILADSVQDGPENKLIDRYVTVFGESDEGSLSRQDLQLLSYSLQAEALERAGRTHLALSVLQSKRRYLEALREETGDKLSEALSIVNNRIGHLSRHLDYLSESSSSFHMAQSYARERRTLGQSSMSPEERLNLLETAKIRLETILADRTLATRPDGDEQIGVEAGAGVAVDGAETGEAQVDPGADLVASLGAEIEAMSASDAEPGADLARMIKYRNLLGSEEMDEASVKVALGVRGEDGESLANSVALFANAQMSSEDSELVAALKEQLKKVRQVAADDAIVLWKYLLAKNQISPAFHALERLIESGWYARNSADELAIERTFQQTFLESPLATDGSTGAELRRYQRLAVMLAINSFASRDAKLRERLIEPLKQLDDETIQSEMLAGDLLIQAFPNGNRTEIHLIDRDKTLYRSIEGGDEIKAIKDVLAQDGSEATRVFLVPWPSLYHLPLESIRPSDKAALQISILPAIDLYPSFRIGNLKPRSRLVVFESKATESLGSAGYDLSRVELSNGFSAASGKRAQLAWFRPQLRAASRLTSESAFESSTETTTGRYFEEMQLATLTQIRASSGYAIVVEQFEPLGDLNKAAPWIALALSSYSAGFKTVIVPIGPPPNATKLEQFATALRHSAPSEALTATDLTAHFRVIGDPGLRSDEAQAACENDYESDLEEAEDLYDQGEWSEAFLVFQKVLTCADLIGEDSEQVLFSMVRALFSLKEYQEAMIYQQQLVAKISKEKNPQYFGDQMLELAILAVRARDTKAARQYLQEAAPYLQAGDSHERKAKLHFYSGQVSEIENDYPATIQSYLESIDHYRKLGEREEVAQRLLDVGNIYNIRLNAYLKAIDYYGRAAEEFREAGNEKRTLDVLIDRANVLRTVGELDQSIVLLREEVLGRIDEEKNAVTYIRGTQELINSLYFAGQYGKAKELNSEMFAFFEDYNIEQPRLIVDALNFKALLAAKTGDRNQAFAIFAEAEAIAKENREESQLALIYNNLGYWKRENGEIKESIWYLNKALVIDERLKSEANISYDLRNLAMSIIVRGDLSTAAAYLEKAKKTSVDLNLPYNSAYCSFGLAEIAFRREKWDEATMHYREAIGIARKGFLEDFLWRAYFGISLIEQRKGDLTAQLQALQKAVDLIETMRAGVQILPSPSRLSFEAGIADVFDAYVGALIDAGREREAWAAHESHRQRRFVDQYGLEGLSFANPNGLNLLRTEREVGAAYSMAVRKLEASDNRDDDAKQAARELREKRISVIRELETVDPILLSFVPQDGAASFDRLIEMLPDDRAVIDYRVEEDQVIAWTFVDGQTKTHKLKLSRQRLRALVQEYRMLMRHYSSPDHVGKMLESLLIKPLQADLGSATKLLILPDDQLHFLPFAALNVEEGYAIDKYEISYAEALWMQPHSKNLEKFEGSSIFAMGLSRSWERAGLPEIPFAEREVLAIKRYFPDAEVHVGAAASEERVKRRGWTPGVAHLAAHGTLDSLQPMNSHIALMPGGGDDGKLRLREVFEAPLGAELMVLSSCESGFGKLNDGSVVEGWHRGFFYSGARRIVSALWRINDLTSAIVMKRFYRSLAEGEEPAAALRHSMIIVKEYYPHPAYWSGFKLVGL